MPLTPSPKPDRSAPRGGSKPVTSPEAWAILVAPARAEIVEAMRLLGPCSIGEIAEAIGRPPDTLYRHIEILERAGFVREAGVRKGDRNLERLVDVVADDFFIAFADDQGIAENRAIVTTAESFLGAMGRAVRDSAAARQLVFSERQRNISINYELSWLRPEDFEEVRALIGRLKQIMDEGKSRREGRLYMTLAMACPVTRKRGVAARPADAPEARSKAGARRASAPATKSPNRKSKSVATRASTATPKGDAARSRSR